VAHAVPSRNVNQGLNPVIGQEVAARYLVAVLQYRSYSGDQQGERSKDLVTACDTIGHLGSELFFRNTGQLRREHGALLAIYLGQRHACCSMFP
jgi:hypothetical protein